MNVRWKLHSASRESISLERASTLFPRSLANARFIIHFHFRLTYFISMADPSYVLDSHRARVPSPLTGHESSLYSKTRHCMPESMHELKPNALAVAILKPDQKVEGPKSEGQYLWVKCASKTTAVKILQQCKLRLAPSSDELVLKHGPRIVDPHTPMSELVDVRDHLVVLEVFTEPELSSRMLADRQPLRPTQ